MKIIFLYVGKTEKGYLEEGLSTYISRIKHYAPTETVVISEARHWRKLPVEERKKLEGEEILKLLENSDIPILLDESGRQFSSEELATTLDKKMASGAKRLVLIVGGAYGFSEPVYKTVGEKWSLSRLTFSHQMVRLFLAEQIYRAFTILRNEPYHNR